MASGGRWQVIWGRPESGKDHYCNFYNGLRDELGAIPPTPANTAGTTKAQHVARDNNLPPPHAVYLLGLSGPPTPGLASPRRSS